VGLAGRAGQWESRIAPAAGRQLPAWRGKARREGVTNIAVTIIVPRIRAQDHAVGPTTLSQPRKRLATPIDASPTVIAASTPPGPDIDQISEEQGDSINSPDRAPWTRAGNRFLPRRGRCITGVFRVGRRAVPVRD
jgi:hypothetical protein